jgi:hypothetical protein
MTPSPEPSRRISISEAAALLDRRAHTIRTWEYRSMLPEHLRPHRDERGRRHWTPEQIEGIRRWLVDEDIRPGKGLAGYRPTTKELAEHRRHMRGPRSTRPTQG